jgi:hypothetical protein
MINVFKAWPMLSGASGEWSEDSYDVLAKGDHDSAQPSGSSRPWTYGPQVDYRRSSAIEFDQVERL